MGIRRSLGGVRVQHVGPRCGQNCGHRVVARALGVMTEAGVHATQKKGANFCLSAFGPRRDLAVHSVTGMKSIKNYNWTT